MVFLVLEEYLSILYIAKDGRATKYTIPNANYWHTSRKFDVMREGIIAKIYTLKKSDGMKSLADVLKKYSKYPDADKRMLEKFTKKNIPLLTIKEGTWYKGDNETIDNLNRGKIQQETIIDGFPSIIVINKLIDAVPLPLSEVQGEILTAYQEYLEANWVKQLKGKYSVKIDSGVLEEIRKNLNNE